MLYKGALKLAFGTVLLINCWFFICLSDIGNIYHQQVHKGSGFNTKTFKDVEGKPLTSCGPEYICKPESGFGSPYLLTLTAQNLDELETRFSDLHPGGSWTPDDCVSDSRMAIIIPYRDRMPHLLILLNNLIPFLQKQRTAFDIFLIEQSGPELFNRAALLNVGYLEASLRDAYDCFIFHDVDLLPTDLCNLYSCKTSPRHLAVAMNKFDYKLPYRHYVGGVLAVNSSIMQRINGLTNSMFGWGGEDDDTYHRFRRWNISIARYHENIARYDMIFHERDEHNPSVARTMKQAIDHWRYSNYDGLNSTRYTVQSVKINKLLTHINVTFDGGPRDSDEGRKHFKEATIKYYNMLREDYAELVRVSRIARIIYDERRIYANYTHCTVNNSHT